MNFLYECSRFGYRVIKLEDEEEFVSLYTSEVVMKHIGNPLTQEGARHAFRMAYNKSSRPKTTYLINSILSKTTHEYIGMIGLTSINHAQRTAELGIMLTPLYQGRGIANTIYRASLNFAFEQLLLCKVYSKISLQNTAMIRLAESTGFVLESQEEHHNQYIYSTSSNSR